MTIVWYIYQATGQTIQQPYNNNERDTGYWKFNYSLLKDNEYIQLVKKTIKEVKNTYKIIDVQQDREFNIYNYNNKNNNIGNNNNNNNNSNQDIENTYSINDQLPLEMILLAIGEKQ